MSTCGLELTQIGSRQTELGGEEPAIAVEDFHRTCRSALVPHGRQLRPFANPMCQLLMLNAQLLVLAIANQRIGNVSEHTTRTHGFPLWQRDSSQITNGIHRARTFCM